MLPPGQAATSIMPSAMLGAGLITMISRKVKAGSSTNCPAMPMMTGLGMVSTALKSATLRSSATPNITRPMMALSAQSDPD
jgi:hypothetical protein